MGNQIIPTYIPKSHFTNVCNAYASKTSVYTTNLTTYIVSNNYLVVCTGTYKLFVQANKPTFTLLCSFSLNEFSDSVFSALLSRKVCLVHVFHGFCLGRLALFQSFLLYPTQNQHSKFRIV